MKTDLFIRWILVVQLVLIIYLIRELHHTQELVYSAEHHIRMHRIQNGDTF